MACRSRKLVHRLSIGMDLNIVSFPVPSYDQYFDTDLDLLGCYIATLVENQRVSNAVSATCIEHRAVMRLLLCVISVALADLL